MGEGGLENDNNMRFESFHYITFYYTPIVPQLLLARVCVCVQICRTSNEHHPYILIWDVWETVQHLSESVIYLYTLFFSHMGTIRHSWGVHLSGLPLTVSKLWISTPICRPSQVNFVPVFSGPVWNLVQSLFFIILVLSL